MKYVVDNDLHIHSQISACSGDPEQSTERIMRYAMENNLRTICLTDHFWDETIEGASAWYMPQNYAHISQAKPLMQKENVRFLFGCETELTKELNLGISRETFDSFDFVVIPTTHFHMVDFTVSQEDVKNVEARADTWLKRLDAVLNMDLPFGKVGIAHLTCGLIAPAREEYREVLRQIDQHQMEILFTKAAKLGVGIELNSYDMDFSPEEEDIVLRPYRIARDCGCKFYLGSDAHHPDGLDNAKALFQRAVDLLELTEDQKFIIEGI